MTNTTADQLEVEQSTADGAWYWHRKAPNGQVISSGEGYTRRESAILGAERANPDLTAQHLDCRAIHGEVPGPLRDLICKRGHSVAS